MAALPRQMLMVVFHPPSSARGVGWPLGAQPFPIDFNEIAQNDVCTNSIF